MSALFGAPPAATFAWLKAAEARAGQPAGQTCTPGQACGLRATPVPAKPSYTFNERGHLRGAVWTSTQTPTSFEEGQRMYAAWEGWISTALNAGPTRATVSPAFERLTANGRLDAIKRGFVTLGSAWSARDGWVRLQWGAGGGLVVRVETSAHVCEAPLLAEAAFALFPPMPAADRAEAAARLAACQDERAVGAIAEQAHGDPDEQVRQASVRSLGALPGLEARQAIETLVRDGDAPAAVRTEGVAALADNGAWSSLRQLALDPQVPEDAVVAATRALEPTTSRLDEAALKTLRQKHGRAVDVMVAELEKTRRSANATASASATSPETAAPQPKPGATTAPVAAAPEEPTKTPAVANAAPAATVAPVPALAQAEPGETDAETLPVVPDPQAKAPAPGPPVPPVALKPPRLLGPADGTPLAIGAATVGGAALMRNLSLLGLESGTSQVLLGSAGAIIGFGTAFGLARFGLRPDLTQAAWFTNVSAWGTLAGLTTYAALADEDRKLRYGALVIGELAGMIAGAATAKAYHWTAPQIVFADSVVLASGLTAAGFGRLTGKMPSYTPVAIGAIPVMTASALLAHNLEITDADVRLLMFGALGGGWSGGFIASGQAGTHLFDSRAGQGGWLLGLGGGYLAATLAAPFVDVSGRQLLWASTGFAVGNMMGGGLAQVLVGASRNHDDGLLSNADGERWKLGAGLGGLTLGLAAGAIGPHLHPGPSAFGMTVEGLSLGLAAPLFASWASYGGGRTPAENSVRSGSLWLGTTLGFTGGLVASHWWEPTPVDELTTVLTATLGATTGLGLARTLSPHEPAGWRDAAGVYAGAATGLVVGGLFTHAHALTGPEFGGMVSGMAWGTLLGRLAPTLDLREYRDDRATSGGTWLGLGLGGAVGATVAGLTHANGAQVAVPTVAAAFGTGLGAGAGLLVPGTSSRPVRIGVFTGTLATAAASALAEPWLHLSKGFGPSAPGLGFSLGTLGAGYGLLLAGGLDRSGLISETPDRQLSGGVLLGATAGLGTGLVLSRYIAPSQLDQATLWGASALGASAGFGLAHMAEDHDSATTTWASMAGAGVGTVGASLFLRQHSLTPVAAGAGLLGTGWGFLAGRLAPALVPASDDARHRNGGSAVGMAVGAVTAAGLTQAFEGQLGDLKVATQTAAWGLALGAGGGLLLSPDSPDDRAARAGALLTSVGTLGAGALFGRRLHLVEHSPEGTFALTTSGAAIGLLDGLLLASLAEPDGTPSAARARGGALFGSALGLGSGWLAAHLTEVPGRVLVSTWASTGMGALAGFGAARMMTTPETKHGQAIGALTGSLAGTTAALVAGHYRMPEGSDIPAAALGSGLAGLTGWLAPSLSQPKWSPGSRPSQGGLAFGVGMGAFAGVAARRLTDADDRTLGFVAAGALDGFATGLGAGLVITGKPDESSSTRPLRLGLLSGTLGGALLGGLGAQLPWRNGAPPEGTPGLVASAMGLGALDGLLVASLAEPDGSLSPVRALGGGLFGAGLGLGGGWLAAHYAEVPAPVLMSTWASTGLGALAGFGAARMITTPESKHGQAIGTLTGSLAGTTAALVAGYYHTPDGTDLPAAGLGSALGGLTGWLVPSLSRPTWNASARLNQGGLAFGVGMGAFSGVIARRLTQAENRTLGLISAGAVDGLATGLGAGLAFSGELEEGESSRALRAGALSGALGGALLGGLSAQLTWRDNAHVPIMGGGLVGAWTGYWAGTLAYATDHDQDQVHGLGAAMAGAGAATFLSAYASTQLDIDPRLVTNAIGYEALFSAAGGGIAAVVSDRARAIPVGVLTAGTAGLIVGGALHERLRWTEAEVPQLSFGTVVGAWTGALLPHLVRREGEVNERAQAGGVLGGAALGFGMASLLSIEGSMSPIKTAILTDATVAGAAVGGGLGFLMEDASVRARAGMAIGGTALGLGFGALMSPHVLPQRVAVGSSLGMVLGASEALLFAWSSNPSQDPGRRYGGAALAGAGVGTALGIAGASFLHDGFTSVAPPAAGFGAWGGWVGSFGAAFFDRDRAVVTSGGIIGTDLGFAAGYALIRTGVVDPSDFGWLSLFAAAGTVLGAGVGAPLSSASNPRPVLAGLSVGTVVGMGAGALALPRLRALRARNTAEPPAALLDGLSPDPQTRATQVARLQEEETRADSSLLERRINAVIEVTDWSPLVGAMPTPSQTVGPTPVLFGVVGHLK